MTHQIGFSPSREREAEVRLINDFTPKREFTDYTKTYPAKEILPARKQETLPSDPKPVGFRKY